MKNELTNLSSLISRPFAQHYINFEQRKLELTFECNIVRDALLHHVFSCDTQVKSTRYICYHHKELIVLLNRFASRTEIICIDKLISPMVDLLNYIEFHFGADLDPKAMIAQMTLVDFQMQLKVRRQNIIRHFRKKEVDVALVALIETYFSTLEQQADCSYTDFNYHTNCVNELERLSIKKVSKNFNNQVIILLGKLNFNNIQFLSYCRNLILDTLKMTEKRDMQIDLLSNHIKMIRLIQIKPNSGLYPDAPNVVDALSSWVLEERMFLEVRKLNNHLQLSEIKEQEKIEVAFSVSQLALFIKILIEDGHILNTKVGKILHFFTNYFKTPNVTQISVESLRNNFYDVDPNTITSLKGKLIGMVNAMNKMKEN